MDAYYNIVEFSRGLRISVRRQLKLWERLATAAIVAAVVAMAAQTVGGPWWVFSPILAVLAFNIVKSQKAQLQATNLEFVTTGHLGRRAKSPRVVCTADVRQLEYQEPFLGTRGLYAVTSRRKYLILPFLDLQQTIEVIGAIEVKFPGLAEQWHKSSPAIEGTLFTSH